MIVWLTALGHMIRDGWPPLGSTFLARLAGASVVGLGLLLFADWMTAAVLGLAILAGFYTDMQHGEANKGDWTAGIISGCTSLAPLVVAAAGLHMSLWWLAALGIGAVKPLIWRAAWLLAPLQLYSSVPQRVADLLEPTRVAAAAWGAVVGGVLCAVLF